jgi:hypothetical protein
MAVLLRNARTGLFYAGYHAWRLYPEQGFDFQSFKRANDWISTTELENVEVIQLTNGAGEEGERDESPRLAPLRRNDYPTEIAFDVTGATGIGLGGWGTGSGG